MDASSESNSVTRSVSQNSAQSHHSTRRTSRTRKFVSHPSSSASSIAASDKSLTSFPSFSPANRSLERLADLESQRLKTATQDTAASQVQGQEPAAGHEGEQSPSARALSIVESLTGRTGGRDALFEDTPLRQSIPGALHQADQDHIERLVARHGAVALVRRIAEDLAVRDSQMAALRRRTDERERALRRIVRECGLSSLDLETRLRAVEQELRCKDEGAAGDGLSGLMSDAMQNTMPTEAYGETDFAAPTIRASSAETAKGPLKGWKGYLWGTSRARQGSATDKRPTLQHDMFSPPAESMRSSSGASSMHSANAAERKSSTSLASLALRLVAGGSMLSRDADARGRACTTSLSSTRPASVAGGPRALMAMRRSTPAPSAPASTAKAQGLGSAKESYGPVEMDAIVPPESQPPTLSHLYNKHYDSSSSHEQDLLTDRFGFIYDQRRKKRQREAAQVAQAGDGVNADTMSSGGDDNATRWQDYLHPTTGATELLSHTPSISVASVEVTEGEPGKSAAITATGAGLVPLASPTTRAVDSMSSSSQGDAAKARQDAEPVRLLLAQLSEAHDSQQRDKTAKWNDFLRKVRAERRREGEAAMAAAAAAAEARFQQPAVMLPETRVGDGEVIGIAGLGIKGKVGRAKWKEFKALVLGGIPVAYRSKVWSECSGATALRQPGYYDDLVARSGADDDGLVMGQIQMDIHRTLTDNIFFRKGPGVDKLNQVLVAYSRRNTEVGYCQGMNLIAANLLLVMASAEDAFWVLASMIENMLPRAYYDQSLMASRADQQVLRHYVATVLPRLSAHLDALGIELEALTFQWFLSVFTDCLCAEALFRVWDVVLCTNDGATFLFQVALALLKLNEANLLQRDTPAGVYTYISHHMTEHAISIDGLMQASEALGRVVRRDDVEAKREAAMHAEREAMKTRAASVAE